jgi:hypothetical protein
MSNIGTISVRFYPRDRQRFKQGELNEAYILRLLLGDEFSYCVPIYMDYGSFWRYFDVQYGSRHASSHAVDAVVKKYGHLLDRTWVRSSNEGGDYDYVVSWNDDTAPRKCRYGVDRIKIYSPHPPDESWLADGDGWVLSISGSYCTLNSRDSLGGDRLCFITTLTTPTNEDSGLYDLMPENFVRFHKMLQKDRYRIEYLWNDRVVHASFPWEDHRFSDLESWLEYSLDYWDNCVDADYLQYQNTMPELDP